MQTSTTLRPKLHAYRHQRGVTKVQAAADIGVSVVQINRYELPFSDAKRQIPREDVMRRIFEWSAGALTPADFYPASLTAEAVQ